MRNSLVVFQPFARFLKRQNLFRRHWLVVEVCIHGTRLPWFEHGLKEANCRITCRTDIFSMSA